ncbi:MAG TPA: hypothetical protein DCQ37_09915 [Desulfobacteraceae bacterium]|nr:hypothetical protein [Desulfobacteraceae bacterium]
MEAVEALVGFFAMVSYLSGLIVIISFCLSRININILMKVIMGIILFFILNIPFQIFFSLAYGFYNPEEIIEYFVKAFIYTYFIFVIIVGIFSVLRDYYLLYKKRNND